MKKIILIVISLLITFITFEILSWYHFGDIPTKVVLIRLIIFFIIVFIILLIIYKKLNKRK